MIYQKLLKYIKKPSIFAKRLQILKSADFPYYGELLKYNSGEIEIKLFTERCYCILVAQFILLV